MSAPQNVPALLLKLYEGQVAFLNDQIALLKSVAGGAEFSLGTTAANGKKSKKEKKEKSDKPKRLPSAYNLFMIDSAKALKESGAPHKDIMTMVSKEWNTLDAKKKAEYVKKAGELKDANGVHVEETAEEDNDEEDEAPAPVPAPVAAPVAAKGKPGPKPKAPAVAKVVVPATPVPKEAIKNVATPATASGEADGVGETEKKKKKKKKKHGEEDAEPSKKQRAE